ncbi:MAG: hypothetical protein QM759_11515 [Terricaulis sp.]
MSRVVFLAALAMAAPAYADTRYFTELSDVPMPSSFAEINTVGFDNAQTRLVVADAAGAQNPTDVRSFYTESLPALGWSQSPTTDGSLVFVRGRERLLLDVSEAGGRTHLHVQLVVRAPPPGGD